METSTDNIKVSDLSMVASMENLDMTDINILADADDEDNQLIIPNIEESLGKKEELSATDILLIEYLREKEPVFSKLNDVRIKVSFAFPSNLFFGRPKICPSNLLMVIIKRSAPNL